MTIQQSALYISIRTVNAKALGESPAEVHTSTCISQLSAAEEAQVARPSPYCLGVPKAEPGAEVIGVQGLFTVHSVVACGIVRAAHPNL